jgi:glycerol uptake facilitator-like aquaporin
LASESFSLARRVATEAVGSALLLATVVGSGIMGERLAGGNVAIALLANSLATGAVLVALIGALGPISGAHFNPVVTLTQGFRAAFPIREIPAYVLAQIVGAFTGVAIAHAMFGRPVFAASLRDRSGAALATSELVATFGLVAIVWGASHARSGLGSLAVAGYVTGAYWFTASTCFANPAVTLARAATDTFAGIRPADVLPFIVAQLAGAAVAIALFRWIFAQSPARTPGRISS